MGGPSTGAGMNYQIDYDVHRALDVISRSLSAPHKQWAIRIEPRAVSKEALIRWDLAIDSPEELLSEAQTDTPDILDWLDRVQTGESLLQRERFLVYSKGGGLLLRMLRSYDVSPRGQSGRTEISGVAGAGGHKRRTPDPRAIRGEGLTPPPTHDIRTDTRGAAHKAFSSSADTDRRTSRQAPHRPVVPQVLRSRSHTYHVRSERPLSGHRARGHSLQSPLTSTQLTSALTLSPRSDFAGVSNRLANGGDRSSHLR